MKLLCAFVAFWAFAAANRAEAQWGLGPAAYFNYGYANSLYTRDYVPYYAMHPPVYYSEPVPRTYGYSPFAYNSFVATPSPRVVHYGTVSHRPAPKPVVIENPYFKRDVVLPSSARKVDGRGMPMQKAMEAQEGVVHPAAEFAGFRGR